VWSRCVAAMAVALAFGGGCGGSKKTPSQATATTTSSVTLKVESSIADGQTLGDAVQWTATPSDKVTLVEFLVDDAIKWRETTAPYVFNDDSGILPPWLLGPGQHRLTVRATALDGRTATATSTVTVATTPTGDSALAGKYERMVTQDDIARVAPYRTAGKGAFGDATETGKWTMAITAQGLVQLTDPEGGSYFEPYTAQKGSLKLYGPAVWLQANAKDPFLFCEPEKQSGYNWTADTSNVVIAASEQMCADRDAVFVGRWHRTS
jgi:hypothetical protein